MSPRIVSTLVVTELVLEKLGAHGISPSEADETLWNRHVLVRNRRGTAQRPQPDTRRLLLGQSDGGRYLTLVIQQTSDPTTWLLITGWDSTIPERMLLERS